MVVNENIDKIDSALHGVGLLQNSTSEDIVSINQNQDQAEIDFNATTSAMNDLEDRIIAMEERGVFACDPGDYQDIIESLMLLRKDIENQCANVGRLSRVAQYIGTSFSGGLLPNAGISFESTYIFNDGSHDIYMRTEEGLVDYLDKS